MCEVNELVNHIFSLTNEPMTLLKLEKLCYYAQAWHYTLLGRPIIKEDFIKADRGPALNSLREMYREYDSDELTIPLPDVNTRLEEDDSAIVLYHTVGRYSILTGAELSQRTHMELPWLSAKYGEKIQPVAMTEYFQQLMNKNLNELDSNLAADAFSGSLMRILLLPNKKQGEKSMLNTSKLEQLRNDKELFFWQYYSKNIKENFYAYTSPPLGIMSCEKTFEGAVAEAIKMLEFSKQTFDTFGAKPQDESEKELISLAYDLYKESPQDFKALLGLNKIDQLQGEMVDDYDEV